MPHIATPRYAPPHRAATLPPNADDVPTTIYFFPLSSTLKLFLTLNDNTVPLSSVDVIRPYSFGNPTSHPVATRR